MIGGSDPHTVILHTDDGSVGAFVADDGSTAERRVASDFALFFRGLGTLFCERARRGAPERFADELAVACGADPTSRFWHEHRGVYRPRPAR